MSSPLHLTQPTLANRKAPCTQRPLPSKRPPPLTPSSLWNIERELWQVLHKADRDIERELWQVLHKADSTGRENCDVQLCNMPRLQDISCQGFKLSTHPSREQMVVRRGTKVSKLWRAQARRLCKPPETRVPRCTKIAMRCGRWCWCEFRKSRGAKHPTSTFPEPVEKRLEIFAPQTPVQHGSKPDLFTS